MRHRRHRRNQSFGVAWFWFAQSLLPTSPGSAACPFLGELSLPTARESGGEAGLWVASGRDACQTLGTHTIKASQFVLFPEIPLLTPRRPKLARLIPETVSSTPSEPLSSHQSRTKQVQIWEFRYTMRRSHEDTGGQHYGGFGSTQLYEVICLLCLAALRLVSVTSKKESLPIQEDISALKSDLAYCGVTWVLACRFWLHQLPAVWLRTNSLTYLVCTSTR